MSGSQPPSRRALFGAAEGENDDDDEMFFPLPDDDGSEAPARRSSESPAGGRQPPEVGTRAPAPPRRRQVDDAQGSNSPYMRRLFVTSSEDDDGSEPTARRHSEPPGRRSPDTPVRRRSEPASRRRLFDNVQETINGDDDVFEGIAAPPIPGSITLSSSEEPEAEGPWDRSSGSIANMADSSGNDDSADVLFRNLETRLDHVWRYVRRTIPNIIEQRENAMCDVITRRCAQVKTDVSLTLRKLQLTLDPSIVEAPKETMAAEYRRQAEANHQENMARLDVFHRDFRNKMAADSSNLATSAAAMVDKLRNTFKDLLVKHNDACLEMVDHIQDSEFENFTVIFSDVCKAKNLKTEAKIKLVNQGMEDILESVDAAAEILKEEVKADYDNKKTEAYFIEHQVKHLAADVYSARRNLQNEDIVSMYLAKVRRSVQLLEDRLPRLMSRLQAVNGARQPRMMEFVRQMVDENARGFFQQNADLFSSQVRQTETRMCHAVEEKRQALVTSVEGGVARGRDQLKAVVRLAQRAD